MAWNWVVIGFGFLISSAQAGVVVFSGGGTPSMNHYSQYLQTKSLTLGLRKRLGSEQISVAFGAGNRSISDPLLADVVRESTISHGGETYEINDFIVGEIEGNHEANRSEIQKLLKAQAKPGAPLMVLISDHGNPNPEEDPGFGDNCITLWASDLKTLEQKKASETCYSRKRLEADLTALPAEKVIFGMSQCYSGGFHEMSVKRTPMGQVSANRNLCGFTATVPDLTASGCTDKVDGPDYAGYERFFTSQILGEDFVSHEKTKEGAAKTLREAHQRATLEDFVGDIPHATSDYYLLALLTALDQTKTNLNFNPKFHAKKLLRRVDYFSNLSKGLNYFKDHPNSEAALYAEAHSYLVDWSNRAKANGLLDVERLLALNIRKLSDEMESNRVRANQAATAKDLARQNFQRVHRSLFPESSIKDRASDPLLLELGLKRFYLIYGEEWLDWVPVISTLDPEAGRAILLYQELVESRKIDSFNADFKNASLEIKNLVQERREHLASFSQSKTQYDQANLRYRLIRSLLRMRNELGVLGAAIQSKSTKVLETYRALIACESTPIDPR